MKKLLPIFAVILFACQKKHVYPPPPPLSFFRYTIDAKRFDFDSVTGSLTVDTAFLYKIERRNLTIDHVNGIYTITAYDIGGQLAAVLRWKADSIRPWEIYSVFEDTANKPSAQWGQLILTDYNSNNQTLSVSQKYGVQIQCMWSSSDSLMTFLYNADGAGAYEGYYVSGQLWIGKQSFQIKP